MSGKEQLLDSGDSPDMPDDTFYDPVNTTGLTSVGEFETTDPEEQARSEQEWKEELAKLEDEITTLRQVLGAKVRAANELKRKLGITPIAEFRHDLKQGVQNIKESDAYQKTRQGIQNIRESDAYQKTNATLKTVGEKTVAAVSGAGAFASRKLSDIRHSNAFKSFEDRVGGAYSNVKTRVRGSKSENSFGDALNNSSLDAERSTASTPTKGPDDQVPL